MRREKRSGSVLPLDNKANVENALFSGVCCRLESFAAEYALIEGLAG